MLTGITSLGLLPSVNLSIQLTHECKGQASIPNQSSLPGGSGRMVPIVTNTTTNSNQL